MSLAEITTWRPFWSWIRWLGEWVVVVGIIGELLDHFAPRVRQWSGEWLSVDQRRSRVFRRWRRRIEFWAIILVIGGLVAENVAGGKLDHMSESHIAFLTRRNDHLEKRANHHAWKSARLSERAARLNKLAADARERAAKLEAKLAPRTFTKEQWNQMQGELRRFAGQSAIVVAAPEGQPDSQFFAGVLGGLLSSSGWSVTFDDSGELAWMLRRPETGIWIEAADSASGKVRDAGGVLLAVLRGAGNEAIATIAAPRFRVENKLGVIEPDPYPERLTIVVYPKF